MKALVVGATGKHANLVVPELKQRGATICALVWDIWAVTLDRSCMHQLLISSQLEAYYAC